MTTFLKEHKCLDSFEEIWHYMPPYPEFILPEEAFREFTQWQGKKMRMFGRIVLVALAISYWKPTATQRDPFICALRSVRSLVDFHLIAQYHSHMTETLKYLNDYIRRFHAEKEIFLAFRLSKTSK